MNELEMEKTRIFKKAFNEINTRFKEIFSNITGGGSGLLQLEYPDQIFDGGVDLLIQFPGKARLSINSASGGEKSVATVCFILALQTINPMPFYIFDEIDAHLDVANTKKLANLLVDRSEESQFIVISLKDAVISTANSVYGTFIQGGSTKIVSFPKLNGENNERA
jgi:chromosome segregation protein